jgi:hypothetical protein
VFPLCLERTRRFGDCQRNVGRQRTRDALRLAYWPSLQVLISDDTIGLVALATLMCEASAELLSGIALEQLLDLDTVDVRRWWN